MNISAISQAAMPGVGTQENPKLKSAAHEFEASMMQEFLKPLQHDSLFSEKGDEEDDSSSGSDSALMSFGSEAMARAISEHGGFGIAQKILDHFRASGNSTHPTNGSGDVRF